MNKKVVVFIGVFVIIVFASVEIYNQIHKWKMERDYQEGIKRISEGKYNDAGVSLVNAYTAKYKHATVLFNYAAAMEAESSMRKHYLNSIPDNYDGPLSEQILESKRTELDAIKLREEAEALKLKEAELARSKDPRNQATQSDDFYTATLGKAASDIRYVTNASDCRRIENYLRDAEKQCVRDPKCDRRTLDMLNKAIDAVQRMYR
jgi:hypothetical protein